MLIPKKQNKYKKKDKNIKYQINISLKKMI